MSSSTYMLNPSVVHRGFSLYSNKVMTLSIPHPKEENELTKLFHINIQVKKTKVDELFDFIS